MIRSSTFDRSPQADVTAYFETHSDQWNEVYSSDGPSSSGVWGQVIRDRHDRVLAWIDALGLATGARVLEIGCGAGHLTAALVQRGFRVEAIDVSEAMVELTRRHAAEIGRGEFVSVHLGDARSLEYADASFDLVIAVGVIAWLDDPVRAVREMARVGRPDGHVLLTTLNRRQLGNFLDPWRNPVLLPVKQMAKGVLERRGHRRGSPTLKTFSRRALDDSFTAAGLTTTRGVTLGYGPFTLLARPFLPASLGAALHHRLQNLADRGAPILRSTGNFHILLAQKSGASSDR